MGALFEAHLEEAYNLRRMRADGEWEVILPFTTEASIEAFSLGQAGSRPPGYPKTHL